MICIQAFFFLYVYNKFFPRMYVTALTTYFFILLFNLFNNKIKSQITIIGFPTTTLIFCQSKMFLVEPTFAYLDGYESNASKTNQHHFLTKKEPIVEK